MKRFVEDLEGASPTYDDIGSTLAGDCSNGFRRDHAEVVLGHGTESFQRAVRGLKTWKAHRLPGMRVFPDDREIRTGATVIVTLGTPIAALAAPVGSSASLPAPLDGASPTGHCPAIPSRARSLS